MNVTVANTINFAKDSLNLVKKTTVNYGGRAITQLKHLPVTMHEDFRAACGVTATVTAVALVAGNYLGNKISKQTKSLLAGHLTFGATLASAYAGVSYATGFPQNKTVSVLIVVSLIALRCFLTISKIQSRLLTAEKERDDLQSEKTGIQTQANTLLQENTNLKQQKTTAEKERDDLQSEKTGIQTQVNTLLQENTNLKQQKTTAEKERDDLQSEKTGIQTQVNTLLQENTNLKQQKTTAEKERDDLQTQNNDFQKIVDRLQGINNAILCLEKTDMEKYESIRQFVEQQYHQLGEKYESIRQFVEQQYHELGEKYEGIRQADQEVISSLQQEKTDLLKSDKKMIHRLINLKNQNFLLKEKKLTLSKSKVLFKKPIIRPRLSAKKADLQQEKLKTESRDELINQNHNIKRRKSLP